MAPEISVVVLTYGQRERLRACLESLARQTARPEVYEAVVVDDPSAHGTEEMLAALSTPYELRVITQPPGGSRSALNLGAEQARGRFLLLLDDSVDASPGLVAAHLDVQLSSGPAVAVGRVIRSIPRRSDWLGRRLAEEWRRTDEERRRDPLGLRDVYRGNLSVERSTFLQLGGIAADPPAAQDVELALRLHEHGVPFVDAREAITTQMQRVTWRDIVRDAEQCGREDIEVWARHPAALPWLQLGGHAEPAGVFLTLRTALLATRMPPAVLAALGLLVPGRRASSAWHRFTSSYAYWNGVRKATSRDVRRRLRRGVLILMYHGIGASGEGPTRFVVPAARFERQMMWLKRRRYNVMSLDEYLRCRAEYRLPPPKTVVVTLDDGYLDNITIGRPILERLGVPATIFVVSGVDRNTWSTSEDVAGRPLMSLDDTQRALGGVITFGAHSRTHPKLPEVSPPEAEREVGGSKEDLEAGLGVPITTFAYPYGRVNDDVREIVVAAGFACACGVVPGRNRPAADNYLLRRMEVFGTDRLPRFALIVWLGEIGMKWRRRT